MASISIKKIYKNFGSVTAVDNLSLDIKHATFFTILGSSGSGKTTTLRMLNRLIEPNAGEILMDGKNILQEDVIQLRRRMGYVIQQAGLFPHFTVEQNIGLVPKLLDWPKGRIHDRAKELLDLLHIPTDFLTRYPAELSGGQQQRIGIARALAADPPVLLMDEPFGALDPLTRQSVRQEFKKIAKTLQKTVVMVTHDLQEAAELSDEVALMHHGRLQQAGHFKELLSKPASEWVSQFMEGQRFSLSLQLSTLKELLTQVQPVEVMKPEAKIFEVSENKSLAETLEISYLHKSETVYIQITDSLTNQPIKLIDRHTLLKYFDVNF